MTRRGRHARATGLSTEAVGAAERRKVRARQHRREGIWFGLGMFGLVGWAVAIPMLAGLALGVLIDASSPGQYSWTLMMLVLGVAVGCLNAWYWVNRQHREIERERNPSDSPGETAEEPP